VGDSSGKAPYDGGGTTGRERRCSLAVVTNSWAGEEWGDGAAPVVATTGSEEAGGGQSSEGPHRGKQ
jgi:hypothetical protein